MNQLVSLAVVVALPFGFALLSALVLKPLKPELSFPTVLKVSLVGWGCGFALIYGTYLWTMFVAHRPFSEASPLGILGGLVLAGWMIRSGLKARKGNASEATVHELRLD